jgi:alkylation response protein AidB-like acyl-CoA dehydrogenase
VAASLDGIDDASGLCTFIVDRDAPGTRGRIEWNALGMRGTATEGLVLEKVFVADENALAIPGAFAKMCTQSRSGYVGNQVAASSIYLAGAFAVYHAAMKNMRERKYADTGRPLGTGPYQQQLIGEMFADLHTAMLWAQRMIRIETAEPEILSKSEVMPFWRTCKGQVAEHSFKVTQHALKLAGTSGTLFGTPFSRALRDVAMGLVQAFPAERGRLETAKMLMDEGEQLSFGALKK